MDELNGKRVLITGVTGSVGPYMATPYASGKVYGDYRVRNHASLGSFGVVPDQVSYILAPRNRADFVG